VKRSVWILVTVAVTAVGCATRSPVVTAPSYPEYMFPVVPPEYAASDAALGHGEAWALLQSGDLAAAQLQYSSLLDGSPDFYPAEAGLGWVHLAQGVPERAAESFLRATTLAPSYVPALVGRGEAMVSLGRSEEALESFEAALVADPGLTDLKISVDELRFEVVSDRLSSARRAVEDERFAEAATAYGRLIDVSPDSGFLHVELGRVEQQRGNLDAALAHAREAARLDPEDASAILLEGEIHEANGDLDQALAAYERADRADPTEATVRMIERVRERLFIAGLPSEVSEIPLKDNIVRGDLAVLLGVRFDELLADSSRQSVIITDTRDHWGSQWIRAVAEAGLMSVEGGSRFVPSRSLRRGDLADVVAEVLDLLGHEWAEGSGAPDRTSDSFADMSATHLSYNAARRSVDAGILDVLDDGSFAPSRPVTGAEAAEAVDRLGSLAPD
jgi:tetratricopeptide (TPR) repeat protein